MDIYNAMKRRDKSSYRNAALIFGIPCLFVLIAFAGEHIGKGSKVDVKEVITDIAGMMPFLLIFGGLTFMFIRQYCKVDQSYEDFRNSLQIYDDETFNAMLNGMKCISGKYFIGDEILLNFDSFTYIMTNEIKEVRIETLHEKKRTSHIVAIETNDIFRIEFFSSGARMKTEYVYSEIMNTVGVKDN